MALAGLFNIPSNQADLALWSFAHAVHHADLNAAIQAQFNVGMPQYILDPFDPGNNFIWASQHQDLHIAMRQVLGLTGFDLSDPDWKSPDGLAAWIQANANEHVEAAGVLNIG